MDQVLGSRKAIVRALPVTTTHPVLSVVEQVADFRGHANEAEAGNFPSACFYDNRIFMKKSINDNRKIGRGRPATGTAPLVGVRMTEEFQDQVRAWAKQQKDKPPLASAIRRLVEIGLSKSEPPKRPKVLSTAKQSAARAAELATTTIDKHSDPAASEDERKARKRKLVEGPSVFRDARKDRLGK